MQRFIHVYHGVCEVIYRILACLSVAALIPGFTNAANAAETPGVTATSIKLGMTVAQSGPTKNNGIALLSGVQAAIKAINTAGGIHNRKIDLIAVDDGYEPEKTIAAATKLIKEDKVFALVGTYGAPTVNAIIPMVEQENIPLFAPLAAVNIVRPTKKNVFMLRLDSLQEGEQTIKYVVDGMGIKDVGILYQDDAFGGPGLAGIQKALASRGLTAKGRGRYKRNTTDIDEAIDAIMKEKPKVVVMYSLMPVTSLFIKKSVAKGFNPIFVNGSPPLPPVFFDDIKGLPVEVYTSMMHPWYNDTSFQLSKEFQKDMTAAGSTNMSQFALEGYFYMKVFAEGLKRAGKDLTRPAILKALESIQNVDFGGVNVTFGPDDHEGVDSPYMAKVKDGKLEQAKIIRN
jgi:ABC-type branched-subunit amino acid transport system substrate-binding protein